MTSVCCAFAVAFFYPSENIILNNIYNNNINNKEMYGILTVGMFLSFLHVYIISEDS